MSSTQSFHSITLTRGAQFGARTAQRDLFVLPGLLGYGDKQIEPLRETLVSLGYSIIPISYVESDWKPQLIALEAVTLVRQSIRSGRQPTLFGVSLGGVLAALISDRLTLEERPQLAVVPVDSPSGADTPVAMSKAPRTIGTVFGSGAYGVLNGKAGNGILGKMMQPPKRQFVEVPERIQNEADREAYIDSVINQARAGLSGHTWKTWGGQLGWLSSKEQPRLASLASVQRVLYFQCRPLDEQDPATPNNNVVVQPLAAERWAEQIPGMTVVTVPTDHCGFLEASATWNRVIREHLSA